MAVVPGCQEVQGACLEGCLERLAEALEGLKGLKGLRRVNGSLECPLKTDGRGGWLPRGAKGLLGGLPWKGLRTVWSVLRVWGV